MSDETTIALTAEVARAVQMASEVKEDMKNLKGQSEKDIKDAKTKNATFKASLLKIAANLSPDARRAMADDEEVKKAMADDEEVKKAMTDDKTKPGDADSDKNKQNEALTKMEGMVRDSQVTQLISGYGITDAATVTAIKANLANVSPESLEKFASTYALVAKNASIKQRAIPDMPFNASTSEPFTAAAAPEMIWTDGQ